MSKYGGRVNRLIQRTHRFIPISAYRAIAESFRLRLAELEKRPDLERRVEEVRVLLEIARGARDPGVDARIKLARETDEEAWLAHFQPFWESKAKRKLLGDWQPLDVAANILQIARRAEAELERRRNNGEALN